MTVQQIKIKTYKKVQNLFYSQWLQNKLLQLIQILLFCQAPMFMFMRSCCGIKPGWINKSASWRCYTNHL